MLCYNQILLIPDVLIVDKTVGTGRADRFDNIKIHAESMSIKLPDILRRNTDNIILGMRVEFFDSRKGEASLPLDADANGAYNIARKGLMVMDQIKSEKKPEISNEVWLNFAQKNDR